jgi:hypothetical protein
MIKVFMEEVMKIKRLISVFIVFAIALSFLPMSVSALSAGDYMGVTRNKSYNKNGKFYASYTVENRSSDYLTIIGQYLNSSGKVLMEFDPVYLYSSGESDTWNFGMDFSGKQSGTYTFKLTVYVGNTFNGISWYWTNKITHEAPKASISYKSYETYYDSNGVLMHKINITCKNMKGQRMYCKVYDENGYLMNDWGSNTPVRKTNNEVGTFSWSGNWYSGETEPSGNYTFVISNSANNTVITKTLWLNIPQRANG